jgi:putative DNA primase/helicase
LLGILDNLRWIADRSIDPTWEGSFFVIDFVAIKRAALQQALLLLSEWLPNGHLEGDEYVVCNPTRTDQNPGSFKVNVKTGVWSDFATDDKGGDLISLFAYARKMSQGDAARELAGRLGLNGNGRHILTLQELADAKGLPVPVPDGARPRSALRRGPDPVFQS